MLYKADTRELVEVVAPGLPVSAERMQELAAAIGGTSDGKPVSGVVLVFIGGKDEAEAHLPAVKRFGLECRALVDGAEVVLHKGSRVERSTEPISGTLLPILREASWPHIATCAHRRLLVGPAVNEGPFVTFCWDEKASVTRFEPKHLGTRTLGDVEGEAVANLAKTKIDVEKKADIIWVTGEYASEGLLMPDLLRQLQKDLACKLLVAAVPKEGGFAIANMETHMMPLLAWSRKIFDEAKGRRISPSPFMVQDGAIIGYASGRVATEGEAPDEKKPWWKFW